MVIGAPHACHSLSAHHSTRRRPYASQAAKSYGDRSWGRRGAVRLISRSIHIVNHKVTFTAWSKPFRNASRKIRPRRSISTPGIEHDGGLPDSDSAQSMPRRIACLGRKRTPFMTWVEKLVRRLILRLTPLPDIGAAGRHSSPGRVEAPGQHMWPMGMACRFM